MKTLLKPLLLIVLSLILLFGLSSCKDLLHFYDFETKNITNIVTSEDFKSEDYFTSEAFEFARLENVYLDTWISLSPYIEYEGDGDRINVYTIYMGAYSQTGTEKVIVKNVTLKEKDGIELVNCEVNMEIEFQEPSSYNACYVGYFGVDDFTELELRVEHGKEFICTFEAELIKDDEVVSKSITYELVAYGYSRMPEFYFGISCSSCSNLAYHRYAFDTENTLGALSDFKREDYFTSEVLEFARLENVVIRPITQVTNAEYEGGEEICILSIYVEAYSQTGTERVIIKNVTVKEGDSEVFNYAVDKEINIKGYYPNYYWGILETGTFTEVEFGLEDTNEFTYIIDLELIKDGETISKSMEYEVTSEKIILYPTV